MGNIGVFQAMSMEKNAFADEDVKLAELLISHANEAIKRIETEQEMAFMSLHDRLTGLYNRVYFEEEIQRLNYSRLYPISIVSADIDGLKLINDTMGHSAGDDLLKVFRRNSESQHEEFRRRFAVWRGRVRRHSGIYRPANGRRV